MHGYIERSPSVALVLAGGIALGAYEAGAYAALHEQDAYRPAWLVGSSIGSVTAAIIAGNPVETRVERLRQFWGRLSRNPLFAGSWPPQNGLWRQAYNQAHVLQTFCFGRPGLFRPRLAPGPRSGVNDVAALYDLDPLRRLLAEFVDFDRLNNGDVRVTLAATDVVSGERVVFDTARETRIGVEHVLASCALIPVFAPIELDGRLLADGCLSSNIPVDLVLSESRADALICFAVDLFAREGTRPTSLSSALSRAGDLAFGNQTRRILEGEQREYALRQLIGRLGAQLPLDQLDETDAALVRAEGRTGSARVVYLGYRAGRDEAGPGKGFDFSRATIRDRWRMGADEMELALDSIESTPFAAQTLRIEEARAPRF